MDDFARSAEAEATCIRKVSHQIVVERFLKFSIIRVCINSRPSRRPSVKVVNQNGSVQLGEKAAEYFLGCINLRPSRQPSVIP